MRENKLIEKTRRLICAAILLGSSGLVNSSVDNMRHQIKGMTTDSNIKESDMEAYKMYGWEILRMSFAPHPLINQDRPYLLNQSNIKRLKEIIKVARSNDLKIILDPHWFPGMKIPHTTTVLDEIWQSEEIQDVIIRSWREIALITLEDVDVIVGYDILNEPSIDLRPGRMANAKLSWNYLAKQIVAEIRKINPKIIILIEPTTGFDRDGSWINRMKGMRHLEYIPDDNIIYSPHFYLPVSYTHQGAVKRYTTRYAYPGSIDGEN